MKKLKIYLFASAVIFGTGQLTFAQEHVEKPRKYQEKEAHFENIPDLTDTQKTKIKSLQEDYRLKYQQLAKDDKLSEDSKREAYHDLRKQKQKDFKAVLTVEQRKELKANYSDHKKMEHKAPVGEKKDVKSVKFDKKSMTKIDRIDEVVSLSDTQRNKLQELSDKTTMEKKEIWNNTELSKEEKKAQLIKLKKQQKESAKKILTKEQLKKLEESKMERTKERSMKKEPLKMK